LTNVPGEPDDPSYNTSPMRVMTFYEVVGSKQLQIAVGEA